MRARLEEGIVLLVLTKWRICLGNVLELHGILRLVTSYGVLWHIAKSCRVYGELRKSVKS